MSKLPQQLLTSLLLTAVPLLSLAGCGESEDKSAQQTLDESLDRADENLAETSSDVEQAENAIDDLRQQGNDLADRAEDLEDQLQSTAEKQVNLYQAQFDQWEARIADLPAEQERGFTERLEEIKQMTGEVKAALEQYTQGDAGADAWEPIAEQLEALKEKFNAFTSELTAELE